MKYPIESKVIIDVTKAPYFADNTGKTDCTAVLCRVLDDVLIREAEERDKTVALLTELSENFTKDVRDGMENRVIDGKMRVIFPKYVPSARIIYFPAGTYTVSDTVSYTFQNGELKNIFQSERFYELTRCIHIMGESRESVTIRLTDNAKGFEKGSRKPVLSLINVETALDTEPSNVSQLNTVEDLSIDCGSGNEGAVGLRFVANNSGRIENMTIKANGGFAGIVTVASSELSAMNVTVEGFDYGVMAPNTSVEVWDNIDLAGNKKAAFYTSNAMMVCKNVRHGDLPLFLFEDRRVYRGSYYVIGDTAENARICEEPRVCADAEDQIFKGIRNAVYFETETPPLRDWEYPTRPVFDNPEDWVCVDDFGAIGDGVTDSTAAIQAAMNSGSPVVVFGDGHYLVDGEITIPATVKLIDFLFCDFFSGERLHKMENRGLFHINEDSDEPLWMERLYTFEQFYGYFRLIKHGARRDLVMRDLHTQAASMYFNTVPGSKIYMDNCIVTTGTYSCNCCLHQIGRPPYYSRVIPFEFHGQTVYGKQINPERADLELLNDNSLILLDGFKVEGPGTALYTQNGGKTYANVVSCGIGYFESPFAMFTTREGELHLTGASLCGAGAKLDYTMILDQTVNGETFKIDKNALRDIRPALCYMVHSYHTDRPEEFV